jgi:hypothetical protein
MSWGRFPETCGASTFSAIAGRAEAAAGSTAGAPWDPVPSYSYSQSASTKT